MDRTEKRKLKNSHVVEAKRVRNKVKPYGINKNPRNFNDIFDRAMKENCAPSSSNSKTSNISQNASQNLKNSGPKPAVQTESSASLSVDDILPTLAKMSATITYLRDKTNNLSNEIRLLRNSPRLQIGDQEVSAEEVPLLQTFESYELPISNKNQLDQLEDALKTDKSFYVFFVSV